MSGTPIVIRGLDITRAPFQRVKDEKIGKNQLLRDRLILSATILARWWQPVASGVALDPLHQAMHLVLYRRTAMASKMASKYDYGAFLWVFFCM